MGLVCLVSQRRLFINPATPSWIPRRPVPDAALPPASVQASFRWNDDGSDYEYLVIPAKAGIQWFRQYMPAQRE